MIKQIAIIGLGQFGCYLVDELMKQECEILVIDKDPEMVDEVKQKVSASYIADVISEEVIRKLVPTSIDAVIVDLGNTLEAACLVTNYLRKIGVFNIIVKTNTEEQGEILRTLGAHQVIIPYRSAAKQMAPIIISDNFKSFFPIGDGLVMVEIKVPEKVVNKTLSEADLRNKWGVNIVGIREGGKLNQLFGADYRLLPNQLLMVVGEMSAIEAFTGESPEQVKKGGLKGLFSS